MNAQFMQVEQSSDAWLKMRLGVITASCAHDLLPSKTGKGAFKQARQTYMNQLIAEVCTGRGEEINAKALSWGKENEIAARAAYSFESGEKIQDGGFIYGMDKRVGASPDGIVVGKNKGLELKCPYSSDNHIKFLIEDEIKDEYITQVQWSMWVAGFDEWDFASFDPRMKKNMIKIVTFKRDEEMMKMFSEIVPQFIKEMDAHLEKLGMSFGSQWL
jgi:exodeoxyribonuclease (lambda-induced)